MFNNFLQGNCWVSFDNDGFFSFACRNEANKKAGAVLLPYADMCRAKNKELKMVAGVVVEVE